MAEHDLTTLVGEEHRQEFEWLADLMSRALWPLEGLIRTLLKHEDYDDLMSAVVPLLDGAKANLAILEDVMAKSFGGHIKVEATDMIETYGLFLPDYFGKAYVPDKEEEKPQAEGQPQAHASPNQWEGPSPAKMALINATKNNIEARADRLINPDPGAPLDAAEVTKIGQEIKIWAAYITKDLAA